MAKKKSFAINYPAKKTEQNRRQECYQQGKDRAQSYPICLSGGICWGLCLHMTTSGSGLFSPTGKSCGRSSVGPGLLAIYFPDSSFFLLTEYSFCFFFFNSHPFGLFPLLSLASVHNKTCSSAKAC